MPKSRCRSDGSPAAMSTFRSDDERATVIKMSRGLQLLCGLLLLAGPLVAQAESDARRMDRLVGLCRSWNAAKYLHPSLWSSELDWDAAFVSAAAKVDGTGGPAAYRAVASEMLA